ncbi:hypothetical protein AWJ14_18275 [Hoeflea olei]|uniref:Uncharacterized protein n=1 Tax=Hoeflea olei TaxID=1480615 RepID=A0A1C1YY67_9HYPH|nr:hypothetical protein AWJ14_18275 [Hoeflea olei]
MRRLIPLVLVVVALVCAGAHGGGVVSARAPSAPATVSQLLAGSQTVRSARHCQRGLAGAPLCVVDKTVLSADAAISLGRQAPDPRVEQAARLASLAQTRIFRPPRLS